jgi:hypothetical protein
MIRLTAAILLIGAVMFASTLPRVGRAQAARKGATTAQAPAARAPLLAPELMTPCARIIPPRTKLYGSVAQSAERCLYAFPGAPGEVITIHATALDQVARPMVRLLAPRGAELVTGTATPDAGGSLIYGYRLRESGLHTVVVETDAGGALSQFRLSVAGNTRCGGKLSAETVITAQLSENARYCVYSFTGKADALWQVETHKLDGGVTPDVALFNPQGISVARQQSLNWLPQQTYQLPADGVYSVLVNAAELGAVGSFELALLPATTTTATADPGLFTPGQQVHNIYRLSDGRVNLRRTPGHVSKPANDVLLNIPGDAVMVILGPAILEDRLRWWPVLYTDATNQPHAGWVAEMTDTGEAILGANF